MRALLAVISLAGCALAAPPWSRAALRSPANPAAAAAQAVAAAVPAGPARSRTSAPQASLPAIARPADPLGEALRRYIRGRFLMAKQKTAQAALELQAAARLAPEVPRIWVNLGLSLYDSGRVGEALQALDRALDLDPRNPEALYFRGRIAAARGELAQAADLFRRLVEATRPGTPYHTLGTYHRARTEQALGNLDAAADGYERLLEALGNPQPFFRRYPELYLLYRSQVKLRERLAELLLAGDQADRAVAVLEKALEDRPRSATLLDLMVRAHLKRGDLAAARRWVERFIEAQPDAAEPFQRLVEIAKAEGRPDGGLADLERWARRFPHNEALALLLASAYEGAGQKDKAEAIYRRLVRPSATKGADPAAAIKLADIHLAAGRPVEALGALAATLVDATLQPAVLIKAAKIIEGLPEPLEVYEKARTLVEGDVPHYGPFLLVGMLAEAAGRPQDALALYDKALSRQPKAALVYSRKADILIRAHRLPEALEVYRLAVRAGLELPVFHRKMGMILEQLGRHEEAVREFQEARRRAPRDKTTAYLLAETLQQLGRYDEAVEVLESLLTQFPKDLPTHLQLAEIHLARGDPAAAEEWCRRARQIAPDSPAPLAALAEVRFRQERWDDAVRLAREALEADPNQTSLRLLVAFALAGKEDYAAAVKEIRALLAAQPENIEWRYLLAGLYSEMGDEAAAERELERILALRPDHAPSNNDLGYLWADHGKNLKRAEAMIRRALEADPKRPAYLDSLGWVLYKQGRFQEALGPLQEAIRLAPDLDPVLWDHLGDSYWRLGRPEEAEKAWKRAAEALQKLSKPAERDRLQTVRRKLEAVRTGAPPPVAPAAGSPVRDHPRQTDARSSDQP